jgi:hypothetical protein
LQGWHYWDWKPKLKNTLTKEFKAQLTTLEKAQEAVEKIEETVDVYHFFVS